MGATHAEKSTVRAGKLNAVPAGEGMPAAGATAPRPSDEPEIKFCKIDDPDCESCQ
jgi:ribonucleoside-diphosphate reductase alpha chain